MQKRVGKNGVTFNLIKFRTMHVSYKKGGSLTIGANDIRVTRVGRILRKYKLDELPQLFNVLAGQMSFVGPRPEVPEFVKLYSDGQKKVLSIKPGITDYASIIFSDENELLASSDSPHKFYIEHIMQKKLEINLLYIENNSVIEYFRIIILTIRKIFMIRAGKKTKVR